MAGQKLDFEAKLNTDHMTFIRTIQEKYNIPSEAKVMRVVMDYLIQTPDVHDNVFGVTRCLRCE